MPQNKNKHLAALARAEEKLHTNLHACQLSHIGLKGSSRNWSITIMICHIDLKPQESLKQMWGMGFSLCIPIVEMLLGMLLLFCIEHQMIRFKVGFSMS